MNELELEVDVYWEPSFLPSSVSEEESTIYIDLGDRSLVLSRFDLEAMLGAL